METEWRDIATAPRDGTALLGATKHSVVAMRWDVDAGGWWVNLNDWRFEPTHWQTFPPAPKDST